MIANKNELVLIEKDELVNLISVLFDEKIGSTNNTPEREESVKLMTRKQLSEKLGISLPTIHKYMKSGKLPYRRLFRKIYFDYNEVLKQFDGGKL